MRNTTSIALGIVLFCLCAALSSSWIKPLALTAHLLSPIIFPSFYPLSDMKPNINIPTAISKFYPLPQEELLNAYSRGNSYLISGNFNQALRELNRAIDVAPENAEVLMTRGIINEKLYRWKEAVGDYKQANQIIKSHQFGKDDATAISNLANAETGLEEWDSALKDFSYAVKLKSDFVAPQIGRALVSYQLDQKKEAFDFFQKISNLYPSFPDGLAAYAVLLFETGKMADAVDNWESAIELDDRYTDIDWVRKIRRWPPKLVNTLEQFQSNMNAVALQSKGISE